MIKKTHIVFSMLMLLSCREEKAVESQATIVTVGDVITERVTLEQRYPASIVALKEVELRADVVGYVTHIHVADGERVRKGQLLYEIDRSRYEAQLDQALSQLAIAEANQRKAERDITRYERLREGNAIADKIYDDAVTEEVSRQQELLSTKAAVENAKTNLSYATIRAPFDGTVGFSSVRIGTLVSPGQTLLNVISADDPIGLDFFADQKNLIAYLDIAKSPERVLTDSIFRLVLPNQLVYPYPGKIETIDRAIDKSTGTIQIRLQFPNNDLLLKPGLNTTLIYKQTVIEPQITIPQKALVERLGEVYVYIVSDGRAKQVTVRTGSKTKDRVVILEGLEPGQQVILGGVQKVTDGGEITIKNDR